MILVHFSVRPRLYSQEPKAVEVGKDSIQLSWRPAELPQFARHKLPIRYMVEMKTLPSSHWEPVARNVHDTSYLVKGLRSDKEYQFRIKALTDFGSSEPSLPVTVYRKSGTGSTIYFKNNFQQWKFYGKKKNDGDLHKLVHDMTEMF